MSINLHIERLVLDGLSKSDAQAHLIGAALETELARLLAADGLESNLQSGSARQTVIPSAIHLTADQPAYVGQKIAQVLYRSIASTQL
jgi:hypothetical protein